MNNIYGFITLNVYALIVIIIIAVIFFKKKRLHQVEDRTYSFFLISNIISTILGIALGLAVFPNSNFSALMIKTLNKLYLFVLVIWSSILTFYTIYISFIKNENKNYNLFLKLSLLILTIIEMIVLILPIEVNISEIGAVASGLSIYFVYLYMFILLLIDIIFIIIDRKNIGSKKYFPIYFFVVFGGLAVLIQIIFPTLNYIVNPCTILITFIMYHTIENPDVKIINQLELAKNSAEKANRAKSDFLSSMSHEIRTPLNAIVGLSDDILTYDNVPDEVKEDSKDIVEASHTLLEIVGNILDINKIESEKMKLVESVYNFKEELNSIAKINKVRIGDKPIQYNINIADDIPDYLYGDKTHIKQILNNLISNAIKYTDKGFININAKCINKNDICLLIISVQDTGKGIKAEDIGKLFTKFERLDIEKNSTVEGTGLGLAITKKLVEMMNGKINVSSNYNQGSIFMVQIPQRIHTKEMPDIALKSKEENNEDNYKNKKVLIVDDNALNIKVAKIALRDFDMEIDECNDGLSCLEKVKQKKYDVILMDIMMPNMSGETALLKLKEIPEFNTPVIALTADAITGAKEKYIEEGFVDYIAKPFRKDEIKEKLDKIFIKKEN